MKEKWKWIPKFKGIYQISNKGKIKSIQYRKGVKGKNGYFFVSLWKNNKEYPAYIHRLLMITFKPKKGMRKLDVAHLNGQRDDNRMVNLTWATRKENEAHKRLHGKLLRGENHPHAKLTLKEARYIFKTSKNWSDDKKLAKKFNVTPSNITCIRTKKSWRQMHE